MGVRVRVTGKGIRGASLDAALVLRGWAQWEDSSLDVVLMPWQAHLLACRLIVMDKIWDKVARFMQQDVFQCGTNTQSWWVVVS